MSSSPEPPKLRPDILAFMPGVMIFLGLYTQVLLLLVAGLALAVALYKDGSKATRTWGAIAIVVGLALGMALWEARPVTGSRQGEHGHATPVTAAWRHRSM